MSNLKRLHFFEIEDQSWLPNIIRDCMTNTLIVMHALAGTNKYLPELLARVLRDTDTTRIIDLCSGSGGPMVAAFDILKRKHGLVDLTLKLTDLYPHLPFADHINTSSIGDISYVTEPMDATNIPRSEQGLRTMICSFHHMRPSVAKQILQNAQQSRQPIFIYEISDNSHPILLTLISMPFLFLLCFFITLGVRPMTWQQIVFTYLIPIIPICFAWDGTISNIRTYTQKDMNVLLRDLRTEDYTWETGAIGGLPSGKLYVIGKPVSSASRL